MKKARPTIYQETSSVPQNLRTKHPEQMGCLEKILELGFQTSKVTLREIEATPNKEQRKRLREDYCVLKPVDADERIVGYSNTAWGSYPLGSDVQDEAICLELEGWGISRRDAEHLTQAICNKLDVFLTYDVKTIIKPYRKKIEQRFPIKVMTPCELLESLQKCP